MTAQLITEAVPRQIPDSAFAHRTVDATSPPGRLLRRYAELVHLPLMCVDAVGGDVLFQTHPHQLPCLPVEVCRILPEVTSLRLIEFKSGLLYFVVPLPSSDYRRLVGVGCVLTRSEVRPPEALLAAAELNWNSAQIEDWLRRQSVASRPVIEGSLRMALRSFEEAAHARQLQQEIDHLGRQIDYTYEEINLLHSLTQNLQISKTPVEVAELCLERMHGLIGATANVIWLENPDQESTFLVKGRIPFDEIGLARLVATFEKHDWSRPLVKNRLERALIGQDLPGLRNFVMVPIAEGSHRCGWILSCNLLDDKEFGTVEASLLASVATILGTHIRNIELYREHEELLLSFVRSFVSTLDAKDPYTRGHSERVALIARRLGEELQLSDAELEDIYLAGLLHDIGKIGVDDWILRKPGQLTEHEFRKIQEHPMIGCSILQELKNLQRVLPGVRHHHESYNGKGYPDGLQGEQIPLMARILAVADSYDAMGSDRPYRNGMPLEKIEEIFQRGSGEQWDARVIDAYFRIKNDVREICATYSPENGNLLKLRCREA